MAGNRRKVVLLQRRRNTGERLQEVGKKWYYLDPVSGVMQTGWQEIEGKWYYFSAAPNGQMQLGWQKIDGKWYYFQNGGAMVVNTSRTIGGKTYYFNADGVCTNP